MRIWPLLVLLLGVSVAACTGQTPAAPSPTPLLPTAAMTAVPTVTSIPTSTPPPTATRTPAPTPTSFVTPPAVGQTAPLPILMYHHLGDLPSNASELLLTWTVAPKNFEAQMNVLTQRGFHTVTMGQLAGYLAKGQPLPTKPIVISFDDGWEEDYSVAFPILKSHNFIGTFFVYTGALDHKQFLTWAQLQEMSAAGMDVESHTLTHPHLRQLAPEAATKEIADSKTTLEKRLGTLVTAFDYPFGEYNQAVIELVKRAGFESAVTIASGYQQRAQDLYTLRRTRVTYTDQVKDFTGRLP